MSSILPSINRNNYNAPSLEEAINQEPLHKSEYSSSSFVPLPQGSPSQKSQLTSSLDPVVPLFSNSNNTGSEITFIDHKIVSLKTSSTLGKLPSLTGKSTNETKESTEGKAAKYNSPLKETNPYAMFRVTNSDILKIIDPTIDTSNEKHAGKKARAKLDQCIKLDPIILDPDISHSELKDRVRNALAQLPRRAMPSSLPPIDSLINQKPVDVSAAPSETRDTSWAQFSINMDDLKTIDPNLNYSKSNIRSSSKIEKAHAKLNKCIDIDPTIILEDHGPLRESKIKNAMEILAQAKPSSSLPPIKT